MKCTECPKYNECVMISDLRRKRKNCTFARDKIPMTNYDRIKNMSIEEMAAALNKRSMGNIDCEKYCAYTKDGRCNKFENDGKGSCVDGIKLWLESEVEE